MKIQLGALASVAVLALAACGSAPVAAPPAAVEQAPALAGPGTSVPGVAAASVPGASSSQVAVEASVPAAVASAPVAAAESAVTTARASSAAAPGPAAAPTPASFRLTPLVYIRQTLNNCGPAAVAEVLHFWGVDQTQGQAQAALRPDGNNRGMWPYGVPGYASKLGVSSLMGVGGNPALLKALVANGFPVIVSQWVSASDHEGHYREIEGFDDNRQVFVSTDSYLGPNHEISYAEFNQIWTGNQRFMVLYPPAKQTLLNAVLASANWDKAAAYQADILKQQARASDPAVPKTFHRSDRGLGLAWDHIQLGNLDAARAEIQQATAAGANPLMVGWLNQALAGAAKG
ncbi:MAG TPA: C39 family peptidase [Chloroflexota bacterium]|nr:C39 family peptidase [Chloroflexota bacterium]